LIIIILELLTSVLWYNNYTY